MLVRKRNGQTKVVISYEEAKEVACPKCMATPGMPCVMANKKDGIWYGNRYRLVDDELTRAHLERIVKRRLEYERLRSSG